MRRRDAPEERRRLAHQLEPLLRLLHVQLDLACSVPTARHATRRDATSQHVTARHGTRALLGRSVRFCASRAPRGRRRRRLELLPRPCARAARPRGARRGDRARRVFCRSERVCRGRTRAYARRNHRSCRALARAPGSAESARGRGGVVSPLRAAAPPSALVADSCAAMSASTRASCSWCSTKRSSCDRMEWNGMERNRMP